jgi:hypothetical protein
LKPVIQGDNAENAGFGNAEEDIDQENHVKVS